ncbi:MAG: chemotaxis protein CheA [Bacteroidales bacterium]|nr:chemotaxis protein CheA [Bacteroidales bacterium]MBN2821093.1 chemotaxis protein CheA [Bacteroidales bacterium]
MKNKQEEKFKTEISQILQEIETQLKEEKEISDHDGLKQVYTNIHRVDETSTLYGINSLSGLFSPIEKGVSYIIEEKLKLTGEKLAIIISAISIGYAILNDPSVEDKNLASNIQSLKKTIEQNFSIQNNSEKEESTFSNSRFQEIFVDEANDLINQLEEKLLQLEGEPDDPGLVDNVFRIMHTLKGNSNMFGFVHLGEITHHLENIYDAIRSNKLEIDRSILEITLQCIDHFRNLIEDPDLSDQSNKVIQESILIDIGDILSTDPQTKSTKKNEQISDGINTYYLFFNPRPNVFDDGSNPLFYVSDLYELGECLLTPVTTKIAVNTKEYQPDKCYTAWHILIATKESRDAILDNFMFLNESSQPSVFQVDRGNILKKPEIIKKIKEAAQISKSIADELVIKEDLQSSDVRKDIQRNIKVKNQDSSIASIRVASAKVDLMMNLISELVTKQAELSMLASENDIAQLQELAESIESISRDLRDNAFSISLIPLEKSVLRFQRLVRDVSAKFNKKVDFVVEGKETELDKTIIEKIVDPIMHILRNSIDHGIETPDRRKELGKPEHGTITLKAYPSGAHVVIEISDDGAGINTQKVKDTAVRKGVIGTKDELTDDDMLKLILSPGFSTADNISEVSGRGVGMDVVYQKISEIRGELDIKTEKNKGTVMTIKLPLTISIIDSLLVKIGGNFYLIPLASVDRCAEVVTKVITENKTAYINLDGAYVPIIDLHKEFNITEERSEYQRLILVSHKGIIVALVVDQIIGNHQAVLKTLGYIYRKQEIISGASILGNGEVALVMDTNRLIQEFMVTRERELEEVNKLNMKITS